MTKENSAGVISFIETTESDERAKLRSVLGLGNINIDPREAHHVIPVQYWQHRVVSIAGLGGFHPTHGFNGVPLSKVRDGGLHGYHPQYNTWVLNQLNAFANNNNISNTGNSRFICNIWIQCRLIPELIRRINDAAYNNTSVNEQFRGYNAQPFVYIGN